MEKTAKSVRVIGYGLCLLYGTFLISLLLNPESLGITTVFAQPSVPVVLFATLFVSSVSIVLLREWGRKLFLSVNTVLCLYFLVCFALTRSVGLLVFFLLSGITALYFRQEQVAFVFKRGRKKRRPSILVVDDDEGILKTVQNMLLPKGYSVLTATSGEKGLQVAKLQKPDLIILDVILPGMKGREVCAVLKERPETKNTPVLFLTAKDSPDDIDAEMAVGGATHITKPVNAKILLAEIKRFLPE